MFFLPLFPPHWNLLMFVQFLPGKGKGQRLWIHSLTTLYSHLPKLKHEASVKVTEADELSWWSGFDLFCFGRIYKMDLLLVITAVMGPLLNDLLNGWLGLYSLICGVRNLLVTGKSPRCTRWCHSEFLIFTLHTEGRWSQLTSIFFGGFVHWFAWFLQ